MIGTTLLLRTFHVFADNAPSGATINCPATDPNCNNNTGLPTVSASQANVQTAFQIVFGIVGAIALLVIIISALRMVTSGGDPETVKSARQTIIFALIGLVICIMAEVIVTFVLGKVG